MNGADANQGPEQGTPTKLQRAEALELELRVRVAELVTERRRAGDEATRLEERAQLPAADQTLTHTASRYRARAEALERELTEARSRLRTQEGTVAALRADRDLGPAGSGPSGGD